MYIYSVQLNLIKYVIQMSTEFTVRIFELEHQWKLEVEIS